jgi:hypothetical protein
MSRFTPEPEMTEFEQPLAALSPSRGAFDRDRLMFEAGRRSATAPSRLAWAWPAVAASLAAVVLGQTIALSRRPEPRVVDRLVFVQRPAPAPEKPAESVVILSRRADSSEVRPEHITFPEPGLSLRRQIERHGLEGLPELTPFLTFSEGAGGASEDPPEGPEPLHPYDLDKFLDMGGPS